MDSHSDHFTCSYAVSILKFNRIYVQIIDCI